MGQCASGSVAGGAVIGLPLIIPAAGLSRRHPGKLLIQLDGRSVISITIKSAAEYHYPIFVVTGFDNDKIRNALNEENVTGAALLDNPDFKSGMVSSIQTGLRSLPDSCRNFGILPGDKPFIREDIFEILTEETRTHPNQIVVPTYNHQDGHPVYFPAGMKKEFMSLSGDTGGRTLIQKHWNRVRRIEVTDQGVLLDMDRHLDSGGLTHS